MTSNTCKQNILFSKKRIIVFISTKKVQIHFDCSFTKKKEITIRTWRKVTCFTRKIKTIDYSHKICLKLDKNPRIRRTCRTQNLVNKELSKIWFIFTIYNLMDFKVGNLFYNKKAIKSNSLTSDTQNVCPNQNPRIRRPNQLN